MFVEEVLFNPFSSLAGDYTEVFEEKWCILSVSAGKKYFIDVSVLNGFVIYKMSSCP